MTKVLGRVVPDMDRPRGPDAKLTVSVPERWIAEGATIEIALPRNLACAVCDGGGCDACERSGAVSLRGRKEPPEIVEVVLPSKDWVGSSGSRGLQLRLSDRGGLPATQSLLPRGNLLITLRFAAQADVFVTRVNQPSEKAPAATASSARRAALATAVALCGLFVLLLWRLLSH